MKIRLGFVSNSSSSSFVLFVTEEEHNRVLGEFGKIKAKNLKRIFEQTLVRPVGYNNFLILQGYSSDDFERIGAVCTEDEEFNGEDLYKMHSLWCKRYRDVFNEYVSKLSDKNSVFLEEEH